MFDSSSLCKKKKSEKEQKQEVEQECLMQRVVNTRPWASQASSGLLGVYTRPKAAYTHYANVLSDKCLDPASPA